MVVLLGLRGCSQTCSNRRRRRAAETETGPVGGGATLIRRSWKAPRRARPGGVPRAGQVQRLSPARVEGKAADLRAAAGWGAAVVHWRVPLAVRREQASCTCWRRRVVCRSGVGAPQSRELRRPATAAAAVVAIKRYSWSVLNMGGSPRGGSGRLVQLCYGRPQTVFPHPAAAMDPGYFKTPGVLAWTFVIGGLGVSHRECLHCNQQGACQTSAVQCATHNCCWFPPL